MTESYEFREPDHLAAGAIGEPGDRTFFLQVGDAEQKVSLKVEKQQVQALAQFLRGVLNDLPEPPTGLPSAELSQPIEPVWVVGQIAVGVDEADAEIVLMIEELVGPDIDEDDIPLELPDLLDDVGTGASVRAHVSVGQAAAFVAQADMLAQGGRPPCRLCGQPENPGGHACPRLN